MTDNEFITAIAPYVQKYAKQYGYKVCSAIIAQACLESAFGRSTLGAKYNNFFGLKCGSDWKGASVNLATKEEYSPGVLTDTRANWRVFGSMEEGVKGYFDFIQYPRYGNLKLANTPEEYLTMIRADGYATSYSYVENNLRIVDSYNLRRFDGAPPIVPVSYAAVVTASALNVRTGAGTSNPVMQVAGHNFVIPKGLCVAIIAECDGWGKLSDIGGWVKLEYVRKA